MMNTPAWHAEKTLPPPKKTIRVYGVALSQYLRAIGVLAIILGLAGCSENRISVETLQAMESHLATTTEPATVRPEDLAVKELHPYQVGPGDILDIHLVGLRERYSEMLLRQRIHPDGKIGLPNIGEIVVGGLDLAAVEAAITKAYVPEYSKDLSVYVELAASEDTTVIVVGAADPGAVVTMPSNERNVVYAVKAAGGFTAESSRRVRVVPVRSDRPEVTFDFNRPEDVRRALAATPPLESGDYVVLESASASAVYVSGLVNLPGAVPVPFGTDTTVLRAIAAAGGTREYIYVKDATLVRELPNGEQKLVKLPLGDMMAGKAPDLKLHAGDIVMLPHTIETLAQDWARQNLLLGPFRVGVNYDPLSQYNINRAVNNRSIGRGGIQQTIASDLPLLFRNPFPVP